MMFKVGTLIKYEIRLIIEFDGAKYEHEEQYL